MARKSDYTTMKAARDREWHEAQGARKELDWKWFMYDLWVLGNHYARWDKNTQQIITTIKDRGKPKVVINKVYTTLRSVRNFVLRNRPRAEVTPEGLNEENVEESNKLNRFLDFIHDKLRLRTKLKGTVWHALKYSVGWWQVLWSEDADDGQGEIAVNVVDPYDLYWDPVARDPLEARYAILAVRKNIEDLKNDPKYKIKDMKGDNQLAASSLKSRIMQAERGAEIAGSDKSSSTIIVREHWYWEIPEGKAKEGEKKERKLMLCTIAGDEIIREPEDTGLNRMPFFKLPSDVEPLSMYGQGWVKNLIPPNRLLNRLESQIAEYNDLMNRGKWVMDKGAGVRVITNENGQIIEKKRGYEVKQENIIPLSAVIVQQIENCNRYIEDIGGAHDASLGRIPTGAKSGKSIEALQTGDSNNMSEIVENIEEFLEDVYEYILYIASQKYQFARRIVPTTETGERMFVDIVGETAEEDVKPENALVIKGKNIVDVKITSWLAQTGEARREALKELYEMKAIDAGTLLEGYNIGAVSKILQKAKEERLEQAAEEIEINKQNQPVQPMGKESGKLEAIAAIRTMLMGGKPVPPQTPSQEYIDYFDMFLGSPDAQGIDPKVLGAIQKFRDSVVQGGPMMQQPNGKQMGNQMGGQMMG